MPYLSKGGITIGYEHAGHGPSLLLLHGWLCHRGFWQGQLTELRDAHHLVALDLRGHGKSSKPRGRYGLGVLAEDVQHVIGALGLRDVVLVGWSLGGLVALELAHRRVPALRGLALVGTTPRPAPAAGYTGAATLGPPEAFLEALERDHRRTVREFASRFFHTGTPETLVKWAVGEALHTPAHVARECADGLLKADYRETLPSLSVPTLVVHGAHDTIFPPQAGRLLADGIPGAALVAFEASAHAPFIEERDRFNQVLRDFVARL